MKTWLALVAMAVFLTGCMDNGHGYPDNVRVQGHGYSVDVGDGYRGGGRGFCPPGHAKKGWC